MGLMCFQAAVLPDPPAFVTLPVGNNLNEALKSIATFSCDINQKLVCRKRAIAKALEIL